MKPIKVYVAGDYSADNIIEGLQNIGKGRKVCAKLFYLGFAPFCPWHDASYAMDNPDTPLEKEAFYNASMVWLEVSDCVYVISGKGKGGGVDAEIKRAKEIGLPVFYNYEALERWRYEKVNGKK